MTEPATRYPLAWPPGWTRAPGARRRAAFSRVERRSETGSDGHSWTQTASRPLTVADAITRLAGELRRLGATRAILTTNMLVRLDGVPRRGQPDPGDPGAAVYFQLEGQPRCLACDRWDRVAARAGRSCSDAHCGVQDSPAQGRSESRGCAARSGQ